MLFRLLVLLLIPLTFLTANTDRSLKMMKIEQRVALVIGNNSYDSKRLTPLHNPINDARAMQKKLQTLGFKVYYGENLTVRQMDKKLRVFSNKLKAGGVGLFFFAGHGIGLNNNKNYLMGKDSNLVNKSDIAYESLEVDKVKDYMKDAGNKINILILDACRNNPFSRGTGGGLVKVDNARGMFIAFATSPGAVADDGSDNNSVFTQEILKHIDTPGITIETMFKKVRIGVFNKTNENQSPWNHSELVGDFYFKLPTEVVSENATSTLIIPKVEDESKVALETIETQPSNTEDEIYEEEENFSLVIIAIIIILSISVLYAMYSSIKANGFIKAVLNGLKFLVYTFLLITVFALSGKYYFAVILVLIVIVLFYFIKKHWNNRDKPDESKLID